MEYAIVVLHPDDERAAITIGPFSTYDKAESYREDLYAGEADSNPLNRRANDLYGGRFTEPSECPAVVVPLVQRFEVEAITLGANEGYTPSVAVIQKGETDADAYAQTEGNEFRLDMDGVKA